MKRKRTLSPEKGTTTLSSQTNNPSRTPKIARSRSRSLLTSPRSPSPHSSSSTQLTPTQKGVVDTRTLSLRNTVGSAVHRYNEGGRVNKDFRDTLAQIAHACSQNLSRSLAVWAQIRPNRTEQKHFANLFSISTPPTDASITSIQPKVWDPTASTFTLWPLPAELCPRPEWSIVEELEAVALRVAPSAYRVDLTDSATVTNDDHLSDVDVNQHVLDKVVSTSAQLLEKLLLQLHPLVPVVSQKKHKPAKTKLRVEEVGHGPPLVTTDQPTSRLEVELDPGLKWQDVLRLAGTLGIHEE